MDAKTNANTGWRPQWRPDGTIEIGVNFYHETSGRRTLGSVSLERYLELWDKGLLVFQQDKKPKPDHLPTREEVVELLSGAIATSLQKSRKRPASKDLEDAVLNTIDPARAKTSVIEVSAISLRARPLERTTPGENNAAFSNITKERGNTMVVNEEATIDAENADTQHEAEAETAASETSRAPVFKKRVRHRIDPEEAPDPRYVAKRISLLNEAQLKLLELSLSPKWKRGLSREYAASEGVGTTAIALRLKKAYGTLGVGYFIGRKKLLQKAFDLFKLLESSGLPTVDPSPMSNGQDHTTFANAERPDHPAHPTPPLLSQGVAGYGPGTLMIQLPPGTKSVTITFE